MIAPTPSDPVNHHGLANAIKHVRANTARHTAQAERGHVPGAQALERLEANAARIQAKCNGEAEQTPEPIEPAPSPSPEPTPTPSPLEPTSITKSEPWGTGRFEIIA